MPSTNGHVLKTGILYAILYARVSTDEQAHSGYSLAQQLEALREYAEREGYEVLEEVADPGQSGASLERPGMDRVRDLVAAGGVSVVLAQDRDRIAREPAYHYLLRKEFAEHGTKIRAMNDRGDESPEGELTDGILDQLAKFERAKTTERTRRGKLRRAKEGKVVPGHTAPYGFSYNEARDNLVARPEQAAVLGRIFEELAAGGSIFGVSQGLMRDGVPAPWGGENWNHNAIRRIALSDLYRPHTPEEVRELVGADVAAGLAPVRAYGLWWFNRKRITRRRVSKAGPNGREYAEEQRSTDKPREEWIAVPVPLADDYGVARWQVDQAREVIASNTRGYRSKSRVWELGGGVLLCAHCGRYMSYASIKRRSGKRTPYYRCQGHRRNGHKQGCPNARHYRALELEEEVWRFVYDLLINPARLRAGLDALIDDRRRTLRGDPDREARMWLEKLQEVERKRIRYQDMAAEELISFEELREKLAALEDTRRTAERELEQVRGRREELEQLERDRGALLARYAGGVLEALEELSGEERHRVYGLMRLNVFAGQDGALHATGIFPDILSVSQTYARHDEGNAYARLGEVFSRLGRDEEARIAYERGVEQAEKYGHGGMADDLRRALGQIGG